MIMRLLNDASATDLMLVPGILKEFEELPAWLKLRFQKGSLYQDEDRVFGWCRDDQIQAVELPVYLDMFSYDNGNENRIVKYIRVGVSDEEGFAPAIDLPFNGVRVEVPVAPGYDFDYTFLTMWEHGWASPCEIQWSWSDLDGYVVERSIIPHGFWKAWEWYPDCWRDYYDKRPELFEDAEWWGTPMPIRHEPPNDPYAAVLGGANKHDVEIFFLDS